MLPTDAAEEGCEWYQPICNMGAFGETVVGNAVENLASAVMEGVGTTVGIMATQWVFVGTFDLTSGGRVDGAVAEGEIVDIREPPPAARPSGLEELLGYAAWISLGICVLALIFLGAMMALNQRRGEGAGHVSKIGLVLFATVLISAASGIVTGVLPSTGPENASRPVEFLQSSLWWYMGAAAVLSVIIGAVRMVWEQRAEPGKELLKSLMTLVVVTGTGVAGIGAAMGAADGFARWIILESTDADFGEAITSMLVVDAATTGGIGAFLAIFVGIFIIFFSMLQMILMIVRVGMVVILAGVFPLAASFTNTEMGKQWFKKCIGWLIAWILYKPAAAIIYAAAFQLVGGNDLFYSEDETGLMGVLVGVTMMLISLIAMPALMKFVAPMASLGAGGVGGAMAGAASLVGGKMADGAMKLGQDQANTGTSGGGEAPTGGPPGADDAAGEGSGAEPAPADTTTEPAPADPGQGNGTESPANDGPDATGPEGAGGTEAMGADASTAATGGVPVTELADRAQAPAEGAKSDMAGAVNDGTDS
ncbi:hypothetical protein KIK06_17560 [Nocardiopsis sp. EMB25]|uniref:hypothetical protein n=1 Tax=Nocardiopsis sp. EMB25 TaxID=2835867 RepID=UPI0022834173|nr:hypothetical protein [Nocardiopsis sp. EMB25]MCY9785696.1 hypothetical protein [Nocardiopsis sp. EMB25]